MKALFDTNIIIDYLNGVNKASQEIDQYETGLISPITWMEVMVGADDENQSKIIKAFLQQFQLVAVDRAVCELAVEIRRNNKIKLPDAIIWASALSKEVILVTRNTRDFAQKHPGIRVPYKV